MPLRRDLPAEFANLPAGSYIGQIAPQGKHACWAYLLEMDTQVSIVDSGYFLMRWTARRWIRRRYRYRTRNKTAEYVKLP